MKRLALLFALLAIALVSTAQDVIVTKKSGRIDAKIIEISDNGVRYRLWEENNGVTHALSADEVASILFANGEVYVFPQKSSSEPRTEIQTQPDEGNNESEKLAEWTDSNYQEFPILFKSGKEIMFRTGSQIEIRSGKTYYGSVQLTKKEYAELLSYCPEAYDVYQSIKGYEVGMHMFGSLSLALMCYGLYKEISFLNPKSSADESIKQWGFPVGISLLLMIPCAKFGNNMSSKINEANTIFNQSYAWKAKRPAPELSMCASLNGFGLNLSF